MLNRNPLLVIGLAALLLTGCGTANRFAPSYAPDAAVAAQKKKVVKPSANKDWVLLEGRVSKLLPTDNNGSRHQHFLVDVTVGEAEGETVKVAHNIDLAPVVPVKVGDVVEIKCEFIKSNPYDVAHWTHYDPRGGEGGYIALNGKKYDRL